MTKQTTMEEIRTATLRRLFDFYNDPAAVDLLHSLASAQKAFGSNFTERVLDLMQAMELHDCGMFPEAWLDELKS